MAQTSSGRSPFVTIALFFLLIVIIVSFVFVVANGNVLDGITSLLFGTGQSSGGYIFAYVDGEPIEYKAGKPLPIYQKLMYDQYSNNSNYAASMQDPSVSSYVNGLSFDQSFGSAMIDAAMVRAAKNTGYRLSGTEKSFYLKLFYDAYLVTAGVEHYASPGDFNAQTVNTRETFNKNLDYNYQLLLGSMDLLGFSQLLSIQGLSNDQQGDIMLLPYTSDQQTYMENRIVIPSGPKFLPSMRDAFVSEARKERGFSYVILGNDLFPSSAVFEYVKTKPDVFKSSLLSRFYSTESKDVLERLLKEMKDKKTAFKDLYAGHSKDSSKEWLSQRKFYNELPAEIADPTDADKIIALKPGDAPLIVAGKASGYFVIMADEAAKAPDYSSAELEKNAREYMNTNEKGKIQDYLLTTLSKEFKAKVAQVGFDKAALEYKATSNAVDPYPINYGGSSLLNVFDKTKYANIYDIFYSSTSADETSKKAWKAVFGTAIGEVANAIAISGGILLISPNKEQVADQARLGVIEDPNVIDKYLREATLTDLIQYYRNVAKIRSDYYNAYQKSPYAKQSSASANG